jgi:hypothetical protein
MSKNQDVNRVLFEAEIERHNDVFSMQPIEQDVLNSSLVSLEYAGINLLAKGNKDAHFYAETMRGAYATLGDVEVVPPYTDQQKNLHIGKIGVYSTLLESFSETEPQTQSSPTEALKTDGRKK